MRRSRMNLIAAIVVVAGGALLSAQPAQAGSCTGPAGARACTCTSGDGKVTCTGDTCTSDETSCTYKDLAKADAPIRQINDKLGGQTEA